MTFFNVGTRFINQQQLDFWDFPEICDVRSVDVDNDNKYENWWIEVQQILSTG